MIKTLSQALRMDKERFKVPKSVQQAIPIQRIWPDGIFQQGTKFSKTYRFTDINYYIASKDNKTEMFLDYSELFKFTGFRHFCQNYHQQSENQQRRI